MAETKAYGRVFFSSRGRMKGLFFYRQQLMIFKVCALVKLRK